MMGEDRPDPYQFERLLSRRGFMGVSGAGAAMMLGLSAMPAAAKTPPTQRRKRPGSSLSDSPDHPPYSLSADCSLSEDHYLVKVRAIDPEKDEVVAYSRGDGQVEAMLLQDGVVSQVYRDPDAVGGWNIRGVPNATGVSDMVAGMADVPGPGSQPRVLHVFFVTAANPSQLNHVIQASDGSFEASNPVAWDPKAGRLKVGTDDHSGLLVYALTVSTRAGTRLNQDAKLSFYYTGYHANAGSASSGILTGFAFDPWQPRGCAAAVSESGGKPILVLYALTDPLLEAKSGPVMVWGQPLPTTGGTVSGSMQVPRLPPTPPLPIHNYETRSTLAVDYLCSIGDSFMPMAVVRVEMHPNDQTADAGELWVLTRDDINDGWSWTQPKLPAGVPVDFGWQPAQRLVGSGSEAESRLLDMFLVDKTSHTLSVVRQLFRDDPGLDASEPLFNPAIPLRGDVAAMSSEGLASSGDQLVVAETDGNLHELIRYSATGNAPATKDDPLSGAWSDYAIHVPDTEPEQVSTYRVQLSLVDDWDLPVINHPLQVTAAAPATALVAGRAVTLSSTATSVTTDLTGRAMLAVVADGLSAPALTVTGDELPGPVTVSPSGPVNGYMTGTTTLNYLPDLDAGTLASATSTGDQPLFPVASANPDDAKAAAGVLAAAATAGAHPEVRSGGTAALGSAAPQAGAPIRVGGVALSFSDLKADALHAIKSGAAEVKHVGVEWDETLGGYASTLTADFDAWGEQVLPVVIRGLEDAAHVFHSVLNYIGTVVDEAIDWLKAQILTLLHDTVVLADRYDGWLLKLCAQLYELTVNAESGADQFIKGKQDDILAALDALKKHVGKRPISSFGPSPHAVRGAQSDSATSLSTPAGAHGNWLSDKAQQAGISSSPVPSVADSLKSLVENLDKELADEGHDFKDAADQFRDALASLGDPGKFATAGVDDLIDAVKSIVSAVFTFAELVVNLVFDLVKVAISALKAVLATTLDDLPLIGPLLKAAGMTKSPTIGGLVSLLVAFPTVLAFKLRHLDPAAIPFSDDPNARHLSHAPRRSLTQLQGSSADDLNFCAGLATAVWAQADGFSAVITSALKLKEPPQTTPAFFSWVDIVAPAIIAMLTVPAHDGGTPFSSPIKLNDQADQFAAIAWACSAGPSVFVAIDYYVSEHAVTPVEKAGALVVADDMLFWQFGCGLFATLFGVLTAVELAGSDLSAAIEPGVLALLGNVCYLVSPALITPAIQASKGVSGGLAAAVSLVCNLAAAALTLP